MANTYTQMYIQFVFAVKRRESLVLGSFRDELEKLICGIVTHHNCKPYAIYCNPDHLHLLVSMHPMVSPSKLMEAVKSGSSKWMNETKNFGGQFSWQKGYGAFTYSKSHVDRVVKYILNQKEHHKKQSFKKEYLALLKKYDITYNDDYLFDWID
ncbi:MAG: IS200/IS605 family transposase [Saprospiraceae bacterium]